MAGTSAYGAPYHDLERYRASPLARLLPTRCHAMWRYKRTWLRRHVPQVIALCAQHEAPVAIPPAWVLALLWDELARRDLTERASDWLLGKLGRDPSVGPYQVTGATACSVVQFVPWGEGDRQLSASELRGRLMDFRFATAIVIGRCQQILTRWRDAGFDPFTPGGLGRHRLDPFGLIATLYSQGLGTPHAHPRSNGRGRQISSFSKQIERLFL